VTSLVVISLLFGLLGFSGSIGEALFEPFKKKLESVAEQQGDYWRLETEKNIGIKLPEEFFYSGYEKMNSGIWFHGASINPAKTDLFAPSNPDYRGFLAFLANEPTANLIEASQARELIRWQFLPLSASESQDVDGLAITRTKVEHHRNMDKSWAATTGEFWLYETKLEVGDKIFLIGFISPDAGDEDKMFGLLRSLASRIQVLNED
jgi:hypothetical protein